MTKTKLIAGAALAALLAGGAIAAPGARGDGPRPPQTRAEVQAKIAEHFKQADANGDGVVTKAEADAARDKMRAAFAEKRQERKGERFAALDTDKNGSLSKEEFLAPSAPRGDGKDAGRPGRDGKHGRDGRHGGWGGKRHGGGMAMMGHWFERADANKDGKVTLAEAQAGPLARFDSLDTNKDGTISPEERKAGREAMRAKWQERRDAAKPTQG